MAHPMNPTEIQASLENSTWLRGKGFCFVYCYWGFFKLPPGHHPARIFCTAVQDPEDIRVILPEWGFLFLWVEALFQLLFHQ